MSPKWGAAPQDEEGRGDHRAPPGGGEGERGGMEAARGSPVLRDSYSTRRPDTSKHILFPPSPCARPGPGGRSPRRRRGTRLQAPALRTPRHPPGGQGRPLPREAAPRACGAAPACSGGCGTRPKPLGPSRLGRLACEVGPPATSAPRGRHEAPRARGAPAARAHPRRRPEFGGVAGPAPPAPAPPPAPPPRRFLLPPGAPRAAPCRRAMSAGWFRRRFLPGGPLPAPRPPRPRASPVPYRRPRFLRGSGSGPGSGSADAPRRPDARPVRSPARGRALPWNAGYAEIINAEKSEFNEDQAACGQLCIRRCEFGAEEDQEWLTLCPEEFLTGHYWALFDGHGGPAAAILAANTLHSCLRRQLEAVVEGMVALQPPMHLSGRCVCPSDPQFVEEKGIRAEDLVIGALENAFQECDEVIGRELEASGQVGGCTALVAVFLQGKLYVANAGDSRAILVRKDEVRPLSSEFTPETERQRIQQLAFVYPELLAGEFTRLEFPRRLKGDDLGQKVLFRDHHMRGWSYKCVEKSDLKYPLIHGQGRQARLLGTLAVSRGLGDHQLRVLDTNIQLKPFLLSVPQVTVLDVDQLELQEEDVVVMATDGLWDVLSNEQVARLVRSFLPGNQEDPHRFSELAKMLIHSTQGKDDGPTGEGQPLGRDRTRFLPYPLLPLEVRHRPRG
uniref:PPM-type phosphatase domain-containing protein n=1 Tax=Canis lupus familiaris TaxID=9615 RepID=A0A8C0MIE9_CANLF